MFENLCNYNNILITGPQRAGTRICTKMVAADTGHEFVDEKYLVERGWNASPDLCSGVVDLFKQKSRFVLHGPGLCKFAHLLASDDDLVVVMIRDVQDIIKSQERISWQQEPIELRKYGMTNEDGPIAKVKYHYWHSHQKERIKNYLEQPYEDLKDHEFWMPSSHRRQWKFNQTSPVIGE